MQTLVTIALLLVPVIIVGGFVVGIVLRRRAVKSIGVLTAYCRGQGWSPAPPDREIGARTLLPYEVTGSADLRIQAQFTGVHRGVRFQAAQVARPPHARRTTFERVGVVYVPRRVPGPRVQIAKRGLSAVNFLTRKATIDNGPFDAAFHVATEDETFARAALPPPLTGALAQDVRAQDCIVALEANHIAALQHGPLTPQGLRTMLDLVIDIDTGVPWQDLARA